MAKALQCCAFKNIVFRYFNKVYRVNIYSKFLHIEKNIYNKKFIMIN